MPPPDFCRDFALSVVGFVRDCPYSDLLAVLGPEAEEQTLVYAEERRDSALCHGYPFLDEIKGNKLCRPEKKRNIIPD